MVSPHGNPEKRPDRGGSRTPENRNGLSGKIMNPDSILFRLYQNPDEFKRNLQKGVKYRPAPRLWISGKPTPNSRRGPFPSYPVPAWSRRKSRSDGNPNTGTR